MKIFVCLILLVSSIGCYSEDKVNQDINQDDEYQEKGYISGEYHNYNDYDEEYVGNPDFDARIERPCRVFDLNCIRRYFAEHSKCKIRRGPLPRNLFMSQDSMYISRVNLTVTVNNVEIGGFRNTRIEDFYINKKTNKMVFSIQIRGLSMFAPTAYFNFFRNSREPIVTVTEAVAVFPSVTYTAIIPNIDDLQLKNAEITAYVDAVPFFVFNVPEAASSPDPTVAQTFAEVIADTPTNSQEMVLTDSQFFPPAYIQYNICDFGLKVLPVD